MYRKLFVALLLVIVFGLLQAQQTSKVLYPTHGPTTPDAYDKGAEKASVQQKVVLDIPKATALHLDLTEVVFNLHDLDGQGWPNSGPLKDPTIKCVYGLKETDVVSGSYFNQKQTLPLGTSYKTLDWPKIEIIGGDEVTSYPPILIKNGELVPGSKNYFVCYKSFILQKFSNFKYWDLTVQRAKLGDDVQSIEHLYIQDNTCTSFGAPTGMYELKEGSSFRLIPSTINGGPTGKQIVETGKFKECGYKSWLDDLVVLAVKINADHYGKSVAELTYTLSSSDTNKF